MVKEERPEGCPKLINYQPTRFMLPTSHYDKAKADRAVTFIENLKHTKGKWDGKPFWLLPWQEQIIRDVFGIVDAAGHRQFRTAYIEIGKKNGKSELAAAVALYLLYADNEPSAEVYGAAADRQQASIVFDVAKRMVDMSPALLKRSKIMAATKRIVNYTNAGFYQVLSAEVGTKHGLNVSGLVLDEVHAQPNRKLYDVLTKGSGDAREQPLYFLITTAGTDKESICYDEYGNIVIAQLPHDLPYLILEGPELPQYKGDKKTISGSYTDPVTPARSFTFTGAQFDVQGTSSQYYERKNYKGKFKEGFVMHNGSTAEKYKLRDDAIPVSTFCFKADVASSEGANNVELVRLYNDACPYQTPAQKSDARVRQGIDGFPIVIFWNNGTDIIFMGKYNWNNDKSTEETFGFQEDDESWEVKNNTGDRVLFKSADYSGSGWLNDFEARFPDTDPPFEDPSQLKDFADWILTTDTEKATGDPLPSSVTYDGVTFSADTAAYRIAKFKAEAGNYMELQSAMFYYLFTELFLMVDSRAKNMFPSFMGGSV